MNPIILNSSEMTIKDFTEKCRSLQGTFREKMGEPMGVGPWRNSTKKHTNMLVHGEKTGKNFVNEFTYEYAKKRVEHKRKNETIDDFRLFNNMLSKLNRWHLISFALSSKCCKMEKDEVTSVFQAIFPDKSIQKVTEVGLEYLHIDIENYLNDRTAMDAIVRYIDTDNKPSFIAIETKYTDVLGTNTGSKNAKYGEWIKRIGMFKPETEKALLNGIKPISQIYRNFLLTESYGLVEGANKFYSVVLAPAKHPTTEEEVASLKNELKEEFQYKISSISLEFFIEKAISILSSERIKPFLYFKERYLEA